MLIRSAFWLGTPKAGTEDNFRQVIENDLAPAMRKLPGVAGVKILWPLKLEDQPPPIACQVLVEFESEADLALMLASPGRAALRPRVLALAGAFEGRLSHIDYAVS